MNTPIVNNRGPKGVYNGPSQNGNLLTKYVCTGEFREPLPGEYFLSGAITEAYRAVYKLTSKYWIARAVEMEKCSCCNGTGKRVKK